MFKKKRLPHPWRAYTLDAQRSYHSEPILGAHTRSPYSEPILGAHTRSPYSAPIHPRCPFILGVHTSLSSVSIHPRPWCSVLGATYIHSCLNIYDKTKNKKR